MHGSYVASFLICSRKSVISHRLQGYCEDLQATANCFAGDFYLTGDRGVQDEVNQPISVNCIPFG